MPTKARRAASPSKPRRKRAPAKGGSVCGAVAEAAPAAAPAAAAVGGNPALVANIASSLKTLAVPFALTLLAKSAGPVAKSAGPVAEVARSKKTKSKAATQKKTTTKSPRGRRAAVGGASQKSLAAVQQGYLNIVQEIHNWLELTG